MEGSTVKKEVRNEVETSEKIWGYVAGEGEFENRGQEPLGPPKRAQKIQGVPGGICQTSEECFLTLWRRNFLLNFSTPYI